MQAGRNLENKAPDLDRLESAGFLIRAGAKILDGGFLAAIMFGLAFVSRLISEILLRNGVAWETVSRMAAIIAIATISLPLVYNIAMLSNSGATLGKKVFGIKVVTRNKQALSFWIALVRSVLEVTCLFTAFVLGMIIYFITTWSLAPKDYEQEQQGITKPQLLFSPIFLITFAPYFLAIFTPGKRALYDFLFVRTLVVKEQ